MALGSIAATWAFVVVPFGPVAKPFLFGAASAGVTKVNTEIASVLTLAAHGTDALVAALERGVRFGRWRPEDVRSILGHQRPRPPPTPGAKRSKSAAETDRHPSTSERDGNRQDHVGR